MRDSIKHLLLAVLTVVLVTVSGQIPGAIGIPFEASLAQTSVLESSTEGLTLSIPNQSERISVSSQSEVLFFTLSSKTSYTLRYLTVVVDSEGLLLSGQAGEWKVYEAKNERVDYQSLVGYGEVSEGGLLRLRLFSEPAQGYQGSEGTSEFALVSALYKEGPHASLKLTFPRFLPEDLDWEFVYGTDSKAWMELNEDTILRAEHVLGLPSVTWMKE